MKLKTFPKITKRVITYVLIADVLLCSLIFAISFSSFNRQFRNQYDSSIREIAQTARDFLNPDDFEGYRKNPVPDEKWNSVSETLQVFVDDFDLNVIYVSAVEPPDYTHIFYFYDPVNKKGKWKPYALGYEEDYYEPQYNKTTRRVYQEGAQLVRHTLTARSGYHITAQIPVYDSKGKIVALLGAQKNIKEFRLARKAFVRFVIITILISAVFFAVFFAFYFNLTLTTPILNVTEETERFSSSYVKKPGESLLLVKNRDELGILANSVYKMEETISNSFETLRQMTRETAMALASAIDAKDKYTHGHSSRVADYSRNIAKRAGKSEEECRNIYLAALLHDVGKIGIPNKIINKVGKLTEEEYEVIKTHPVVGTQILANITRIPNISDGAHYHHERYDGTGYPEGLSGKDIPEIGRIIAVADAYDAMTSNRSYRGTLTQEFVRAQIESGIGSHFDPDFAKIMLSMIDEDKDYKMKEV